jgi:D-3-phosphoglycerate dehydrogenase
MRVTEKVLEKADKLLAIGCYCIGTNQIDLSAAQRVGVEVFNAPFSNTRSIAELVVALSVVLLRNVADKSVAVHRGVWLKDSRGSFELRRKTIGILGCGNIGSQVSVMAEALGMNVVYYDIQKKLPFGNAEQVRDLRELCRRANVVTLHVPSNATTRNMINEETLSYFQKRTIFLNYSRGDVVDLNALRAAIRDGRIGGAVDVFPDEPEKNGDGFASVLQNLPNVILTPHIGGSTEEAQADIGRAATTKLINYIEVETIKYTRALRQNHLSLDENYCAPPKQETVSAGM